MESSGGFPDDDHAASRDWLAAYLLREHTGWLGRFASTLQRLRGLSRGQRRRLRQRASVSLAGAALFLSLGAGMLTRSPAVFAASILVETNTANGFVADGLCSLSEAIVNANDAAATYADCIAGSPGDDEIFLSGNTYSLGKAYGQYVGYADTGLPTITSLITITGNGAIIERDGGADPFRLLAVDGTGNLTLEQLTLRDGYATFGAALLLDTGTATLARVTLSKNEAQKSGGAIFSKRGTLTITSSTLSDNASGGTAGAIYSGGPGTKLLVVNSTISGNAANDEGGALVNDINGVLELENVTLTANSAGSAGGALWNGDSADAALHRSLISGNSAPDGAEIYLTPLGGSVTLDDYNVLGDGGKKSGQALYGVAPGNGDFDASSDAKDVALDDILDSALTDNGGKTFTHALPLGSPAVDFGPSVACAAAPVSGVDQRGELRNQDGDDTGSSDECDSGALEREAAPTPTPTATGSPTPSLTPSASPTPSITPTVDPSASATPTVDPLATATATPSATPPTPPPASFALHLPVVTRP